MHPEQLGRYRVVGALGRGGMGLVYEGHDPQIDRSVAIKTIALDALDEREKAMFEVRFQAEMRSAGRLQHPNIAAIYDTGRDGGTAFIVMELVSGHDLKWHLAASERFGIHQAITISLQLLAALDYAHRRQVIHRDVKPANVILQADGVVKLCDFGVARLADADATRTQGLIVGSLRYASPEQILGHQIDARTDVFSAGVLLFELLTGTLPFIGSSDAEILHRITTEAAPSPRARNPDIPVGIDAAVRRAMAKDPDDRFGSAAEFAQALGGSTNTSPGTMPGFAATSDKLPVGAVARVSGNLRWGWAAGAAAILAAIGAWALLRPTPTSIEPTQPMPGAPAASPAPTPQVQAPVLPPAVPASTAPPASAVAAEGAAASKPATARPPVATASGPPPRKAPLLPAEGLWRGQLVCGPALSRPLGPANVSFTSEIEVQIQGRNIRWSRGSELISSTVAGRFDAQGHFSAEGQGARKDRAESWLEQASGEYVPATRRIEGRMQIIRQDKSVARECTLVARSGSAPGAPLRPTSPSSSSPAASSPRLLALMQGAWRGRVACGSSLSANTPRAIAAAYTADVSIDIAGSRITLLRDQSNLSEKTVGEVDSQGRFKASGSGAFKDKVGDWLVQASGQYLPKAATIEGRMQILRKSDSGLTRECSLVAERR